MAVPKVLAAAVAALAGLLGALAVALGIGVPAVGVGLAFGVLMSAAVARGLAHAGATRLGPADVVTVARATLSCAVATLVVESYLGRPVAPALVTALVTLAAAALVLDAVDGWVARRTRTTSEFGARFDGEADAFLILLLSVYVAASVGVWVLAIGAARYVFGAAGWVLPWLRGRLPGRYWRKVVAAVQGVTLTVVAAEVVPDALARGALAVALVLLAESFGRDVLWLWRHRFALRADVTGRPGRLRVRLP